jgi:hypothetical protein
MYKMHHPKADVDGLYAKWKEGGRGLAQIEAAYKTEIINTAEHLNKKYKEDQFVNIIRSHDSSQPNMNSTVKAAAKIIDELSQSNENNDMKKDGIQNTKARLAESLKKKWENKVIHGQYIRSINKHLISEEDMFLWLSKGDLKAETESEMVAAQHQAMQQKYCKQEQIANADYVINLRRQQTTLCQRAQYLQKNNISSDMIECVLNYTSIYVRNWGQN